MTAIYLNHAGTSWPKIEPVRRAAADALGASTTDWAQTFDDAHARIARFFGITNRDRLLLTPGCTSALAAGVTDLPWRPGDRALCSTMEHHALHRPLVALGARGVELTVIPRSTTGGPFDIDTFERALSRGGVRLVALSAAANTTGELLPIDDIALRAHAHGALVLLDAAQAAGWIPLDVKARAVDLMAFAGHKALQGVWGIGGLYVAEHVEMASALGPMPGYCDTGSVDRAALAALSAGLDWLDAKERAPRLSRARAQIDVLAAVLARYPFTTILGDGDRVPTLAFVVEGHTPAAVAGALRTRGVVASGGHQCAPLAHASIDASLEHAGAVRLSVGATTTDDEVAGAGMALDDTLGALALR